MSPTLAMIVQREAEIRAFVPEPFFTVQLDLDSFTVAGEKLKSKKEAADLAGLCKGKPVTIQSVTQKEKSEAAPRLYDLTTLQREANKRLGYSAQQTLDYTQSSMRKKLCTYPRTDSRFLTDDMESARPGLPGSLRPRSAGARPLSRSTATRSATAERSRITMQSSPR